MEYKLESGLSYRQRKNPDVNLLFIDKVFVDKKEKYLFFKTTPLESIKSTSNKIVLDMNVEIPISIISNGKSYKSDQVRYSFTIDRINNFLYRNIEKKYFTRRASSSTKYSSKLLNIRSYIENDILLTDKSIVKSLVPIRSDKITFLEDIVDLIRLRIIELYEASRDYFMESLDSPNENILELLELLSDLIKISKTKKQQFATHDDFDGILKTILQIT